MNGDARSIFRDDPVVGREIDLPEAGRRFYELDAHLRFAGLFASDVHDAAFARTLCGFIGDGNFLGRGHAGGEGNQRAMRVDHESAGFFVKLLIGGRFALHRDRHAEQNTHTAAPAGISDELLRFLLWCCRCAHAATIAPASVLGNGTIFLFTLFGN